MQTKFPLKWPSTVSVVILAAMWGISAWVWSITPVDAQFAVHFDSSFQPDRHAGKFQGLLLMPLLATGLLGLFLLLPRIDPRAENLAKSSGLYLAGWLGSMLILAGAHVATLQYSLMGQTTLVEQIPLLIGLLLLVIGYFMGKSRSNFFAGIRTPWTLSSDYSWQRTNRLGGILFMISAALVMAVQIFGSASSALKVLMIAVLISAVVSIVASYFFWKRDPTRK